MQKLTCKISKALTNNTSSFDFKISNYAGKAISGNVIQGSASQGSLPDGMGILYDLLSEGNCFSIHGNLETFSENTDYPQSLKKSTFKACKETHNALDSLLSDHVMLANAILGKSPKALKGLVDVTTVYE